MTIALFLAVNGTGAETGGRVGADGNYAVGDGDVVGDGDAGVSAGKP